MIRELWQRLFGSSSTPADPNATLRQLVESRQLQLQSKLLETQLNWYDNLVNPWEPWTDTPDFWAPMGPGLSVPPNIDSQKRGEVLPVYITEYQLKLIRDQSRRLLRFNEFAICASENRKSYIIGKGLQYQCSLRDDVEDSPDNRRAVLAAEKVLKRFIARNNWPQREREAVFRADRDGDVFIRLFHVGEGRVVTRFIEPEHVRSPNSQPEDWFGVESVPGDTERIRHYWVVNDPLTSWNPDKIPAREIVHIKLNVESTAKRGLPTFMAIKKNLDRASNMLQALNAMGLIQASYAVIRKHKNYSASSISAFQQAKADYSYNQPATGKTQDMQIVKPGSIVDTTDNTEYEFPHAEVNAAALVEIVQADLRAAAARLNMPEYMLSADSSNANYACHDSETECLTRRGWLRYDQIRTDDVAATMNPGTGQFEWQTVTAVHRYDHDGEMVRVAGRDIDLLVTPNHRMYTARNANQRINGRMAVVGVGSFAFKRADELRVGDILPLACQPAEGMPVECFELPGVPHARKYLQPESQPQSRLFPMMPFLSFLGWWVSEGWTANKTASHPHYTIALNQRTGAAEECRLIRAATCSLLGLNVGEWDQANGMTIWQVNDKSLWTWLRENGGTKSATKRLPDFVFDLPAGQTQVLLQSLVKGDGSDRVSGAATYFTMSRLLADQVQTLALMNGRVCNVNRPMSNGVIPVAILQPGRINRIGQNHLSRVHYRGVVWCVTVPNGLVITRRNGKSIVTGNSTLVSEAPSTKNFEALQAFFSHAFGDGEYGDPRTCGVMWRVLKIAVEYGLLPRRVLRVVKIQVEGPQIVARDRPQETGRYKILHESKVLSRGTWAKNEGLDYDQEKVQLDEEGPEEPPPGNGQANGNGKANGKGGLKQLLQQGMTEEKSSTGVEDPEEMAPLIADILYHLYGDEALDHLNEIQEAWTEKDHPRGKGGRFIPRGSAEAVAAAKDAVHKVLSGHADAPGAGDIVKHLAILTVKQLRQLHKDNGVKSIPKEILRDQLVAAVHDKIKPPEPKEKEAEKPAAPAVKPAGIPPDEAHILDRLALGTTPSHEDLNHPKYGEISQVADQARQQTQDRQLKVNTVMQSVMDPDDELGLIGSNKSAVAHATNVLRDVVSGKGKLPNKGLHGDANGNLIPPQRSGKVPAAVTKRAKEIAQRTGRPVIPMSVSDGNDIPKGWAFIESPVNVTSPKQLDNTLLGMSLDIAGSARFDQTVIPKGNKNPSNLEFHPTLDASTLATARAAYQSAPPPEGVPASGSAEKGVEPAATEPPAFVQTVHFKPDIGVEGEHADARANAATLAANEAAAKAESSGKAEDYKAAVKAHDKASSAHVNASQHLVQAGTAFVGANVKDKKEKAARMARSKAMTDTAHAHADAYRHHEQQMEKSKAGYKAAKKGKPPAPPPEKPAEKIAAYPSPLGAGHQAQMDAAATVVDRLKVAGKADTRILDPIMGRPDAEAAGIIHNEAIRNLEANYRQNKGLVASGGLNPSNPADAKRINDSLDSSRDLIGKYADGLRKIGKTAEADWYEKVGGQLVDQARADLLGKQPAPAGSKPPGKTTADDAVATVLDHYRKASGAAGQHQARAAAVATLNSLDPETLDKVEDALGLGARDEKGGYHNLDDRVAMALIQKPKPAAPAPAAPAPAAPGKAPHEHVADAVKVHGGDYNLAPLHKVRDHLAGQGITDRGQQDAAIMAAMKANSVSGSRHEGRHGIKPEEKAALLDLGDGDKISYLSARR